MKTIYIAGPMSGIEGYNFKLFDEAEIDLASRGYMPINPARLDREIGFDPEKDVATPEFVQDAIRRDCDAIIDRADSLALLPGWRNSRGALAEKHLAEWKGIPVYEWHRGVGLVEPNEQPSEFPSSAEERKKRPVVSGVLDYFPDAIMAVAHCSWIGNEQHNPGQPLHWSREKSADHSDCLVRHLMQRGTMDSDGVRHSVKAAWRALALAQLEIEGVR